MSRDDQRSQQPPAGTNADAAGPPQKILAALPRESAAHAIGDALWRAAKGDMESVRTTLALAEDRGREGAETAQTSAWVAREILRPARVIQEIARSEQLLDATAERRLAATVEEAVFRALDGHTRARIDRRDKWLSFLSHEIKNPLNTVLNALWLLREHRDAAGRERFFDLAERGVRRIEARLREVRELERLTENAPPTKDQAAPPPPPPEEPPGSARH